MRIRSIFCSALTFAILSLPACICLSQSAPDNFRVASIFGDNMVLQRQVEVPIWGWAKPGEQVQVTARDQRMVTTADATGKWQLRLKPMEAGEPFELSVIGSVNSVKFQNVVVGEVWICSGQSNMEWPVVASGNAQREIAAANFPLIRHVKIRNQIATQPQVECEHSGWQVCSPESAGNFTAVGYYFGRKLHQELNVPVGLINSSWGGTIIEAWTSAESLKSHPDFAERISQLETAKTAAQTRPQTAVELNSDSTTIPDQPTFDGPNNPTALFNAMINPLIPCSFRGVIWYQGESNAGRAYQYRSLFPLLIDDWRKHWDRELPFYWVQLANFQRPVDSPQPSEWAELREAQSMTLNLPATGEAVIIDIGEERDIHPKNKQDVGQRLALIALKNDYGQNVESSGPRYRQMEVDGNQINLSFDFSTGLLSANSQPLGQFSIAGDDQQFVWADAKIDGQSVIVSSETIQKPVAVRYAWSNNPVGCNLTNASGLPASPFRTDDWPGVTVDKK